MPLDTSPNKFKTERYNLTTVRLVNPAAGADVLYLADDNTVQEIMGVSFGFTTSAVVNTRWVYVEHYDAANHHTQQSPALDSHVASLGRDYYFTMGISPVDYRPAAEIFAQPLGCCIEISGGDRFRISTRLLDAGDQFSYVDLRLRTWNID